MDPKKLQRFESMLFNYETTGRSDFRDGEITTPIKTLYKEKPKRIRQKYEVVKYVHTITEWRDRPKFSLFIKPREITQTNPRNIQQKYEKPPDLEREHVQKTRPRLVMTPAVSMDDVTDPVGRDILIKAMYTSDMTARMKEAVAPYLNVRAPYPKEPACSDPVALPKWHPPYVPVEFRKESVTWDNNRLRSYVAPTREFWLSKDRTPYCPKCEESAKVTEQRNMMRQMKRNRP